MGTRNLTLVKLNKETKVAQYGQWDGYPTGQGLTIANFLKEVDIEKFKEEVNKLREVTPEEIKEINKTEDWKKTYPYLSRDTGADILNMISKGIVKFVSKYEDFKNDNLFCEYWYEIDLDNQTVCMNGGKKYPFKEWVPELMEILENKEEQD